MLLKRFSPYFGYLKPVRLQFLIGLFAGIAAAVASGAGLPFVIEYIVPLVTSDEAPEGLALVGALLCIPIVFSVRAIGSYVNAYFMAHAGMHVLEELRAKVFRRLQQLPLAFFQKNSAGDLMSRVMVDTQQLQTTLVTVVNRLVKEPVTLLAAVSALIFLSIKHENSVFMLIALASAPGCVLPINIIGKKLVKKARLAQEQAGAVNSVVSENISAIREVRAYNLEERESSRFRAACHTFFKASLKTVKYNKALTPLIELVTAFAIVLTLYVSVVQGIEPEAIAAILTALYMCYEPVKKLGAVSNSLRAAEASLDRLEYILHAEDSVPEAASPISMPKLAGKIEFQDVSFYYKAQEPALTSVNAQIETGEVVALVGPSGAGKSTFANLVPRFYDATQGTILLDDTEIKQISKHDLRGNVSLVSQEAILFADSIANNIRVGKPDATIEEVQAAAKLAHADSFIEAFEDGYESILSERGSSLSGGQRQRISIARAFLKNAPIIILDEPTSALDAESEHQIQLALEALSKGRTVLIIAHRFSTIQHADRILVFEAGQIVASGSHSELYPSCDLYRDLYDKQSKTALEASNLT
ncbi:MAG: ABC transporter ATP-binding protein [Verrucomicrobiota bacterium]